MNHNVDLYPWHASRRATNVYAYKYNIFPIIFITAVLLVLLIEFLLLLTTAVLLTGLVQDLIRTKYLLFMMTVKTAVFITLGAGASFCKTRTMAFAPRS